MQKQGWAGGSGSWSCLGKDFSVKLHVLSKLVRLGELVDRLARPEPEERIQSNGEMSSARVKTGIVRWSRME